MTIFSKMLSSLSRRGPSSVALARCGSSAISGQQHHLGSDGGKVGAAVVLGNKNKGTLHPCDNLCLLIRSNE